MAKKTSNLNPIKRGNRPDFSEYLSHFTKDGDFCNVKQNTDIDNFKTMTAFEKLCSILQMREIKASSMPWTGTFGICFTECPWSSLLAHTNQYSSYGIGFTKEFIYKHGGSPVFYMRFKLLNAIQKNIKDNQTKQNLLKLLTPYSPNFDTDYAKQKHPRVDYTHEREWRMSNNLHFEYNDIAFLLLKKHEDYDSLPKSFKDNFDRNKIIVMDNYRLVEELWPVHIK